MWENQGSCKTNLSSRHQRQRLSALTALILLTLHSPLLATTTVRVSVTSVSGRDVFIDAGSDAGLTPGLRVRFFPTGITPFDAVIANISSSSARVEINQNNIPPPVGTPGEVQVPDAPATQPSTSPSSTTPTPVPIHPPWSRQEGARTSDMPLLAPAFSIPPNQRPSTFHGRVFGAFDYSMDNYQSADTRYMLGRVGTSWTLTNPFGQGGSLYFDGEFDSRSSDTSTTSSTSNDLILNRFSYAIGEEPYSPFRLELGRFISHYIPEIGWVDGAEGAVRLQNGLTLGGGLGGYPRPFVRRQIEDDLGFHTFLDYTSPNPKGFNATLGYQKTWWQGAPDRDLIVAHANAWLTQTLWLYGSARVDVYGNSSTLKSSGPHLTDAWFQARYTPTVNTGGSLSYSHYTWADVKAPEFQLAPPDLIKNGRVDRVDLTVWHNLTPNLRPAVRVGYFTDQQGSGYNGEIDLDWTNIARAFDLHGDVFYTKGDYTNDYGFRAEARWHHEALSAFLGYELYEYRPLQTLGSSTFDTRHNVRGGIGWQRGDWYFSVEADHYFGNADNGTLFHFYAEYRF